MSRAALEVKAISKKFPGVWALKAVSFDVRAGEVHGLVGENGAGKSTLMSVASGAIVPEEGHVFIDGQEAPLGNPEAVRAMGIAIVRQEPALMPNLSVADNMYMGVPQSRRPQIADKVKWARAKVDAWDPENNIDVTRRIEQLNAQQRFIVEIVKALTAEPKILILDEPTEHLLRDDVERLFVRIRALASKGVGIVYISHRIREVQEISDRLTVLREGEAQGTMDTVSLTEDQIVEKIVGSSVDREFPEKAVSLSTEDVLSVKDLSGHGFHDVTFSVRRGEILGLAGMEGHGKLEVLQAVAGLVASEGGVTVFGEHLRWRSTSQAKQMGIAYLSGSRHKDGMFASLSVRENFSFRAIDNFASFGFISNAAENAAAERAIDSLDIRTASQETAIASLSGGNQQKVLIAGVMEANPSVVLIDEPTQGVDIGARVAIYQIIRKAAAQGTCFIIVSSDAFELAGLCDRILVMSRGSIASELSSDQISEAAIIHQVLTSTGSRRRKDLNEGWLHRIGQKLSGHWAPVVIAAALTVILGAFVGASNEFYLSERNLGGMLLLVSALALVGYGQQLLMLIGGLDLSVGPLMGMTVVILSFFYPAGASAMQIVLGIGIVLLVAALVGTINWALVEPIGMHPMVATLATFMGVQAISLMLRPTPDGMIDFKILDVINTKIGFLPLATLVVLIAAITLEVMLFRSLFGIKLRGMGSNSESARVAGVNQRGMRLVAYVGCSLLAACAGMIMAGQVGVGDALSGNEYTLASIAVVVVGGASLFGARGSFMGVFVAALLITQVNTVTTFLNVSDAYRSILLGLMIILAVAAYSIARRRAVVI